MEELNTKKRFSIMNEYNINRSELPNTFLIPTSLFLVFDKQRVKPNNPKAAISKVKNVEIETMVVKFFSEEYKFFIRSSIVE